MRAISILALLLAPSAAIAQDDEPVDSVEPRDAGDGATSDETASDEPAPADAAPDDEDRPPDVAVLSIGGDASRSDARRARDAVAVSLRQDGMSPLPDGDASLRIPPGRLAECRETACAFDFAAELDVSLVAAVATWAEGGRPSSITVSLILGRRRSYSATEDVGEAGLEAAARAAVTGAQDARRRAILVEGASAAPDDPADEVDADAPGDDVLHRDRSLEEWILPSLLGVVGLGLVGTSVYALLDTQCERVGVPSGDCLRGTHPNYGLGILFAVAGGLSIAGAVLWLVLGGQPTNVGRIDVVMGPDGGAVGWMGYF